MTVAIYVPDIMTLERHCILPTQNIYVLYDCHIKQSCFYNSTRSFFLYSLNQKQQFWWHGNYICKYNFCNTF